MPATGHGDGLRVGAPCFGVIAHIAGLDLPDGTHRGAVRGVDDPAPLCAALTRLRPRHDGRAAARGFDWSRSGGVDETCQCPGDWWQATRTVDLIGFPPTSAGRNWRAAMCLVTASVTSASVNTPSVWDTVTVMPSAIACRAVPFVPTR